jgi:hypothetical protein
VAITGTRSRNQYVEGSRVEVAVPFTPGAGAIFVPIRIVFSQAIPTAGLFRHGAAYIKPPPSTPKSASRFSVAATLCRHLSLPLLFVPSLSRLRNASVFR